MNEKMKLDLYASLLAFETINFEDEIKKIENSFAGIHLDYIDGNFINKFGIPPYFIKFIKKFFKKPIQVHIMGYVDNFIDEILSQDALPDSIFFHIDSSNNPELVIEKVKSKNIKIGISIENFGTKEMSIFDKIDEILIMTVKPGKCGQKFIEKNLLILDKIDSFCKEKATNDFYHTKNIFVDGGVNLETIQAVYKYNNDHEKITENTITNQHHKIKGCVVGSAYKDFLYNKIS
ncbi:hypothetical protein [Candidatus Nesciobacter abundans]|uniref:Ribulose-phosphate 3-epimerase n=1 Tax=Candidatus Nesciobacter abundans TaxID=2601668 RepID=A0A5C0UHE1_9PROT|nr:hypothetical protein [Candidatus Nesciobacter abundans]QEK39127.1 hypothetical protein FZC36_01610 [Candidatus Nesciobacter abundans]